MSRSRAGFTLIEVLVVVAIIMILAAIIYPVYETANKRADAISCLCNIRNLSLAASLYTEDYDGFLVPARVSVGPPGTYGTTWDVLLHPYHRNELLNLCPSDQMATWASGCVCYKHSFGINLDLTLLGGYNGSAMHTSQLDEPTRMILFFEIKGSVRQFGTFYGVHGLSRVDARHNTGSNYAYVDGHARWRHPRDTTWPANCWVP
jgi:prepilin-type N-terminal cleavage/methylation domain-containing protein/prepilin-type processing-associated H-X9-DG protein